MPDQSARQKHFRRINHNYPLIGTGEHSVYSPLLCNIFKHYLSPQRFTGQLQISKRTSIMNLEKNLRFPVADSLYRSKAIACKRVYRGNKWTYCTATKSTSDIRHSPPKPVVGMVRPMSHLSLNYINGTGTWLLCSVIRSWDFCTSRNDGV